MNEKYNVYLVSDSTGETLDRIFLSLKSQFANFDYEKKKRQIDLLDFSKLFGKMSNPINQARLDSKKLTADGEKLYELIHSRGGFKK